MLKPVEKLRGARVKNYKLNENGEPWLVANVLPVWRAIDHLPDPDDHEDVAAFKEFGRDSAARVATPPLPTAADIIGSYYPAVPVTHR